MKKKKVGVLHAQCPYMRGGAELLVENLTKQLNLRGYDAEIISIPFKWYPNHVLLDNYSMWRGVDLTESNGEKIDLLIATKAPTFMVQHSNKVLWLMHQHRVAYDLRDNVKAGGLNTIPHGKETICKIENMDRLGMQEAKQIYTISQTVTDRLLKFNNISSKALYHPPSLVGRYYSDKMEDYILSVGRLDPNKRIDLMLRALPYCDSHIHAVIAGKGAIQPQLEKLAIELGVQDRVHFLGYVPDDEVLKLYANALAVCFPPIDEDYGYITLESFLSKKPIVTCEDSGGVLEFAQHNQNALVCKNQCEEIGEAFEYLYQHKNMAKEFGEAGYQKVKEINWDAVIDRLTETIR